MTNSGLPGDNTADATDGGTSPRESDNLLEKVGDAVGSVTDGKPDQTDDEEEAAPDEDSH